MADAGTARPHHPSYLSSAAAVHVITKRNKQNVIISVQQTSNYRRLTNARSLVHGN